MPLGSRKPDFYSKTGDAYCQDVVIKVGEQGMICPVCHGQHLIRVDGQLQPCPECGGFGEWNCCEGLQEQPPLTSATCGPVSASTVPSRSSKTEPSPEVSSTPPSQIPARNPSPVEQAIPSPVEQAIQNTSQDHPNDDNQLLAKWNQP